MNEEEKNSLLIQAEQKIEELATENRKLVWEVAKLKGEVKRLNFALLLQAVPVAKPKRSR